MTKIKVNCLNCGKQFEKELRYFIKGKLEICDECKERKITNAFEGVKLEENKCKFPNCTNNAKKYSAYCFEHDSIILGKF